MLMTLGIRSGDALLRMIGLGIILTPLRVLAHMVQLFGAIVGAGIFLTHAIEEAVFLADRVVVMTPGSGRVPSDNRIALPRSRDVSSLDFNHIRRALSGKLQSHHGERIA
jgi:ABC-type nitrate/sulfonate/bicarbonate transport system ATPase subunit